MRKGSRSSEASRRITGNGRPKAGCEHGHGRFSEPASFEADLAGSRRYHPGVSAPTKVSSHPGDGGLGDHAVPFAVPALSAEGHYAAHLATTFVSPRIARHAELAVCSFRSDLKRL